MKQRGNNPLTPLANVKLDPGVKSDIRESLLQAMRAEQLDTRPEKTSKSRKRSWIGNTFAGAATVALMVGVPMGFTHNGWFQTRKESAHSHSIKSGIVKYTQNYGVTLNNLMNIHMINTEIGWMTRVSENSTLELLRTDDGGVTWRNVTPSGHGVGNVNIDKLNSIRQNSFTACFPDANHAILAKAVPNSSGKQPAIDRIYIESTDNGGKTWAVSEIPKNLSNPYGQTPISLDFINARIGWLTTVPEGGGGTSYVRQGLYKTTDGGVTWKLVSDLNLSDRNALPPVNADPEDAWVSFISPQVGFTLGEPPTQTDSLNQIKPSLYRTIDGGATWSPVIVPKIPLPNHLVTHVRMLKPEAFGSTVFLPVIVESANPNTNALYVYVSHDDGKIFTKRNGSITFSEKTGLPMQYGFWNALRGWFWLDGSLYTTTDGGQSFQKVTTNHEFNNSNDDSIISWMNENVAFVTTIDGLWKSTDGGVKWNRETGER